VIHLAAALHFAGVGIDLPLLEFMRKTNAHCCYFAGAQNASGAPRFAVIAGTIR